MDIKRFDRLEQALGGPTIEVRDAGDGRFLLSISLTDDYSYLTGPYPTAKVAEDEGIEIARCEGVDLLHIVHIGE